MPEIRRPDPPTEFVHDPGDGGGWLEHGFHIELHAHADGQLVYAASGVLATTTSRGTWVAPANRVTWTPPGFEHSHRFFGNTDVRLVNIPAPLCDALTPQPCVFAVSPLLREVLLAMTDRDDIAPLTYERLRAVAMDDLIEAPEPSLHLPEPRDDRLLAVTALLRADASQTSSLVELGHAVGASERTLSRLFTTELGMSFQRWRTILRVHNALVLLTGGSSVTQTAMESGWSNPSSFIEAFTSIVGQTPGRYQASLRS